MATLTFFKFDRVIQVDDPVEGTSVTVQELVNAIREYEEELDFFDYGHICNAFGKQDLGGGVQVGITLELINDWRIQFETPGPSTTITVYVKGGNLVAVNSFSNNPIKPSDYVTVIIAQSTSPSIITPASDDHLLYLLSSLLGRQKSVGSSFYWNPSSGSDTNDGTTPSTAVFTFSKALTLATAGAGDSIFCVSSHTSGSVTITETLNINTANLKVHGPGINAKLIPTATTAPTVNVAADNIEVSGFYIETAATGTQNALTIDGDNVLIRDSWIGAARGHGIAITSSARFRVLSTVIENCGASGTGDGINLGTSTTQALVSKAIIYNCKNGIVISGTSISDNIIENCLIYKNTTNGVNIADSTVTRTTLRSANTITNNGAGTPAEQVVDSGTDTYQEAPSGGESAGTIAAAVWDEAIGSHVDAGSTGKTLKDAKLKATLASLK